MLARRIASLTMTACVLAGAVAASTPAGVRAHDDHSAACTAIAHVGDSTTAEAYDLFVAEYARWFDDVLVDAGGGRAVLQHLAADHHDGVAAVEWIRSTGFDGCWVVALGTNDAANTNAGADYSMAEAIDAMMTAIDPDAETPVAWVEVFTTKTSGHWHRHTMTEWNIELRAATERWPNLEVLPWAEFISPRSGWLYDGIHHTVEGRAARAAWVAEHAFDAMGVVDPPAVPERGFRIPSGTMTIR